MIVSLGEVVTHIRNSMMPSELPANSSFVGLDAIGPGSGSLIGASKIADVTSRVFAFEREDVLYGRLRPYLRKAVIADHAGSASSEIVVMRCSDRILPNFLLLLLLSDNFSIFVSERSKGDRPRSSFATISSYQFDLPSIELQKRICARDRRLSENVASLTRASAAFDEAATALLDEVRSRLVWRSAAGSTKRLGDFVESVVYGTSQRSEYASGGVPVLRIPNISASGTIDSSDLKHTILSGQEQEKYSVRSGDILLIRSNGSARLVGRAAKVDREHEGFAFAGYLLRVRPKSNVLSSYLMEVFGSVEFRQLIEAASRSSTGIHNLSAGRLVELPIPDIDLENQERIARSLMTLQDAIRIPSDNIAQVAVKARASHGTVRDVWVQRDKNDASRETRREVEGVRNESRSVEDVKTEAAPPDGGDLRLGPRDVLFSKIDSSPDGAIKFEAFHRDSNLSYDTARDLVFSLLSSTPPEIVQQLDSKSQHIVLRRLL